MPREDRDRLTDGMTEEERLILKEQRREERRRNRRLQKQKERGQQHKESKSLKMMKTTTRAAPVYQEEKRLRSDDLFFELSSDLAKKEKNNLESGRNLDRQSLFDISTRTSRETFTCLCTNCPGSTTCTSDYMCTALTFKETDGENTVYSCLNHSENFMHLAYCQGGQEGKSTKNLLRTICCSGHMCNDVQPPVLPTTQTSVTRSHASSSAPLIHPAVFLVVPAVLCIMLLMLTILFIYKRLKSSQKRRLEKEKIRNDLDDNLSAQPLTEDCSIELPDPTSGSGSGMPMLIQRTVAKSVTLLDQIGTGKYGNVYKGLYQGSPVAVKIFLSKDVTSWAWENEIYTTLLLRHENILGFMASDMISCDSVTQFWLICHYHKDGSLYDFLNQPYNVITPSQCLLMLYSAASGLVHLHTEIFGTQAKPAIAHRDIKSKNILVKEDGSCCIADLGLSVMHKSNGNILEPKSRNQMVGTKRYMAPEVLSQSMDNDDFEAYKKADIYSFSLVMWETAQCTIKDGHAERYHMPYGGLVPNDPTFEEMRHVIVDQKRRPAIPSHWANHKIFASMSKLIQDCWSESPDARLTILRIKKSLSFMLEEMRDCKVYV